MNDEMFQQLLARLEDVIGGHGGGGKYVVPDWQPAPSATATKAR